MIVFNTSPLLYLAKLGKLELLKDLFNIILIPEAVYEEAVINGKDYADSKIVQKAINEGWIKIKLIHVKNKEFNEELDIGELEAIELAKNLNAKLLLIDDAPARAIAESFGLNVKGTLYVLLKAYKKSIINKNDVKNLLFRLLSLGFRISPELYGKILEEIDKIV